MSDANPQIIDKESLNESELQLLEIFERRASSSANPDDTGLTSAEELAEPTGTPGSTAPSTAAPEVTPPVEGQAVTSESVPPVTEPPQVEPPAPAAPAPPVEGEPTGEVTAPSSPAFTFAGVEYQPEEVAQGIALRNWYQHLQPQQVQAIDALLSGQYQLVPAHEAASTPTTQVQQPPVTTPASSPSPPAVDDAGEWLDPQAQAAITRLESQLTELRQSLTQSLTPIVQSQQDQEIAHRTQLINAAHQSFQTDYSLNDEQMQALGQAVVQAQIFPSLIQRHNGDVQAATRAALDMMLWTTPTFRDPVLASRAQADVAQLADEQQANLRKQQQLTALSSSGGSVPRRDPSPSTKDDRFEAMRQLIAADMNGQ